MEFYPRLRFKPDKAERFFSPINLDGGGGISYTIPALIRGYKLALGESDFVVDRSVLICISLLTLRLSVLHHKKLPFGSDYNIDFSAGAGIWQLYKFISRNRLAFSDADTLTLASHAGVRNPAIRQDLTWVGGVSHVDAWLVPPPTSAIPQFLSDMNAFLAEEIGAAKPALIAEAILYQFTHVHPLKDGNGRTIRAALVSLGLHRQAPEIIALVWLLIFNKRSVGNAWRMQQDKVNDDDGVDNYSLWMLLVEKLLIRIKHEIDVISKAGLSPQIIESQCCFGYVSCEVLMKTQNCGGNLARKIILSLKDVGWREGKGGLWINDKLANDFTQMTSIYSERITDNKGIL